MRTRKLGFGIGFLVTLVLGTAAACFESEKRDTLLPELSDGFTWLARAHGVIRNASLEGFNVDAVGLAASRDGQRLAAVSTVGQFFASMSFDTVSNPWTGETSTTPAGSNTTSASSTYRLHISDDGGETWRNLPITPSNTAPNGIVKGLILVGERVLSTVFTSDARYLVELDPSTGEYRPYNGVRYEDGRVYQPLAGNLRTFLDHVLVHADVSMDGNSIYASRADFVLGEARAYRYFGLDCIPWRNLQTSGRSYGLVPTSDRIVQGFCSKPDNRVCTFTWTLNDAAPDSTPLNVGPCVSREAFEDMTPLARDGVVPELDDLVEVLPTPRGLLLVGKVLYETEGAYNYRTHAVGLSITADGERRLEDFGRGAPAGIGDDLWLTSHRADLFLVGPQCDGYSDHRGCIGETGVEATYRLMGWDPEQGDLAVVPLRPSACLRPEECLPVPNRIRPIGNDGRYLVTWDARAEEGDNVEAGVAVGIVAPPWGASEPEAPEERRPATALEMRCWGELQCMSSGVLAFGFESSWEHVRNCVDRWRAVQGVPDARWEAFAATSPTDCEGLRATDPVGFTFPSCLPGSCDETGTVSCDHLLACPQLNGGTCSVVDGMSGCYADACEPWSDTAFCDDAGRWVHCSAGRVDDCAARGMACQESRGCVVAETACADGGGFCRDGQYVGCRNDGTATIVDCPRFGATCEEGEGWANCVEPPLGETHVPYCDDGRLVYENRVIDCAALGMTCWVPPSDPYQAYCEAAR